METILNKLKMLFTDKTLRKRILFILAAMVIFRLLSAIPIPGVDPAKLQSFLSNNQFLGVLNIFSGGGLSTLSILMLGVGPLECDPELLKADSLWLFGVAFRLFDLADHP